MWNKVVVKNDWEQRSYYLNGQPLFGGERLYIQWPDGNAEVIEVMREPFYTSYFDHGNTTNVETFKLFFIYSVHGHNIKIYLHEDLEFSAS